jgi:DNA polymerase III alpha subunit
MAQMESVLGTERRELMSNLYGLCQSELRDRYSSEDQLLVSQRLDEEFEVIQRRRLLKEFETAVHVAQKIRDQGGFCRLTGAGCSSLVSYLLKLSDVDPVQHNLPFERFLKANPNRSVPFRFLVEPRYGGASGTPSIACHSASFHELLPHRTASEIKRYEPEFRLDTIPDNDPVVYDLLNSGNVKDVHQFHDNNLQLVSSRTCLRDIVDIAAMTATNQIEVERANTLQDYLNGSDGSSPRAAIHPAIAETLQETKGIILFQEQIMLLLNRIAQLPLKDGYQFVKAAAKHCSEQAGIFRNRFLAAAKTIGLPRTTLADVFSEIETAAKWALCKSHHLAEAVLTYQAAYLKARYPESFDRALHDVPF